MKDIKKNHIYIIKMAKKEIQEEIKKIRVSMKRNENKIKEYKEQLVCCRKKSHNLNINENKIENKIYKAESKIFKKRTELDSKVLLSSFKNFDVSKYKMINKSSISESKLVIETNDIKLLRKSMGKYLCCVNFSDNMNLRITGEFNIHGQYCHPHVSYGTPCLGSYAGMYEQIKIEFKNKGFNRGTFYKLLMFLQKYLTDYTPSSPYIKYEDFINEMKKVKLEGKKDKNGNTPTDTSALGASLIRTPRDTTYNWTEASPARARGRGRRMLGRSVIEGRDEVPREVVEAFNN